MIKLILLMKTLILTAAIAALSFTGIGGNDHGGKYCAKMKDGKMTVMHKGSAISSNVTLDNGATLKPDGTMTMADGTTQSLGDGECVHKDGTSSMKKDKNLK